MLSKLSEFIVVILLVVVTGMVLAALSHDLGGRAQCWHYHVSVVVSVYLLSLALYL